MLNNQLSQAKHCIQRHGLNPVFKSEVSCGDFHGVIGFKLGDIGLQIFCFCIIGTFDLNRDDASLSLDDKINLGSVAGSPVVCPIALCHQLCIDIVLRQSALAQFDVNFN